MDVRIRIGRQLIVNHLGHILNIEASGCHIGRHERTESAGPKGTERPFPLRLAVIAGQRTNRSRFSTQMGRQTSHLILLITKHHRPSPARHGLEQRMHELRARLIPRHDIVGMHDRGRSADPWVDRNASGIALHALRERLNVP
jgi:hypothetical protein